VELCSFLLRNNSNNLNGRLGYGEQDYGLAKKNRTLNMVATGGRHPRTDSAPETGSAYNQANWYRHHGSAIRCEYLNCHFEGSNGSGGDTHPGSRETTMEFNSRDPNRGAWGGSYFGFHGQARSSGTWSGGTHGIRVATEEIPGDVVLDLDVNDLNWDATDNDTLESAALRVDSQSGLTNKARVIGKLHCRNAGIGIHLADEADVNLAEYVHKAITSRAAYLIDDSKLHIDECILDFRNNPRNLSARDAFVMDDASQITIGRLIVRQGAESDQPTAIFKDNDNVSGKLVDIQHLIYDDPDNVGPIPLVTPGREGNFTWLSSRFKHYVAGRYYFPQFFIGTGSAGAVSAGRLYAVPIEILTPTTFTKIGINVTTGATGSPAPARLGIYKDQKGVPGALVVDAGEVDVTTIAAVEATISKTLFGRYWLAVIFESAASLQITLQSSASTNVGDYGAEGPVGGANVLRPSVTYGPLPSTYPSVTSASFDTANIPRIWLRSGV
jgi:hypothetical protein